jgi:hypothetical protein
MLAVTMLDVSKYLLQYDVTPGCAVRYVAVAFAVTELKVGVTDEYKVCGHFYHR